MNQKSKVFVTEIKKSLGRRKVTKETNGRLKNGILNELKRIRLMTLANTFFGAQGFQANLD